MAKIKQNFDIIKYLKLDGEIQISIDERKFLADEESFLILYFKTKSFNIIQQYGK